MKKIAKRPIAIIPVPRTLKDMISGFMKMASTSLIILMLPWTAIIFPKHVTLMITTTITKHFTQMLLDWVGFDQLLQTFGAYTFRSAFCPFFLTIIGFGSFTLQIVIASSHIITTNHWIKKCLGVIFLLPWAVPASSPFSNMFNVIVSVLSHSAYTWLNSFFPWWSSSFLGKQTHLLRLLLIMMAYRILYTSTFWLLGICNHS